MTHDPGTAAIANTATSPAPDETADDLVGPVDRGDASASAGTPHGPAQPSVAPEPGGPGTGLLAVLALAWLGAMLWSAQAAITFSDLTELVITNTAYALPGAVSASLVGGAAVALAVVSAVGRRGVAPGPGRRFTIATLAGLLTGLVGAALVVGTYGDGRTVSVVAGTIAAAGTIGGAVGGIRGAVGGTRAARVVAAGLAAILAVFAICFLLNLFESPLLELYGSGNTQASRASAVGWFALTASVASGLAAGLVAFGHLRYAHRRAGDRSPRWPAYAVAGAGPGLLLLTAEVLARTAGSQVLALAGAVSEADRLAQSLLSGSRVNNALLVTFIGSIVAIVAVGRTISPASTDSDRPDTDVDDQQRVAGKPSAVDQSAADDGVADDGAARGGEADSASGGDGGPRAGDGTSAGSERGVT